MKHWLQFAFIIFMFFGIIGACSADKNEKTSRNTDTANQTSQNNNGPNPAEYICGKLNGELSDVVVGRSFVGNTFRCDVEKQWDMLIMDEVNLMVIENNYFGNAQNWNNIFVDTENYNRRSFSFESDKTYIINLYVPFEKETDHIFISE